MKFELWAAREPDNTWRPIVPLLPKRLVNGQRSSFPDLLMRRRNEAGHWEYRRPGEAEETEWREGGAW
jgi:hypothetical protein